MDSFCLSLNLLFALSRLGKLQVWYVISEVMIIQTGHFFHEKQLIVFNLSLQFLICPSVFLFFLTI